MSADEAEKILEAAATRLGEHFDAVQILASWNENGTSSMCGSGCGNWYARQGMAYEFINSDIAQVAARQIAEKLKDD